MLSDTHAITVDTAVYRLDERWLRGVVARGSGLPGERVVPGNQNVPVLTVGEGSFATVLQVTDVADGRTLSRDFALGERQQVWQYRTSVYRIQFFSDAGLGVGASDLAARFCVWLGSDDALLVCEGALNDPAGGWPAGSQVRFDHPVDYTRLDGLDDSDWEERAYCDLTCRYYVHYVSGDRPIDPSSIRVERFF